MSKTEKNENYNGLILKTHYIPEEVLVQILSYIDCSQLVLCHLVCKLWNEIIKKNIWRKKAERACGQALIDYKIPWTSYYSICKKNPFHRNLLTSKDVKAFYDQDYFKTVKVNIKENNPAINISPFPEDLLFKENINCIIVTRDSIVSEDRKFVVDLIKEGFTDYILDNLQPTIEISEWYGTAPEEEKAGFNCSIKLLDGHSVEECNRVMRVYHFDKRMNNADKRGKWFKFTHVLKNYGPGVRFIKFYDGGHNNIVLAGASIILTVPAKKTVF